MDNKPVSIGEKTPNPIKRDDQYEAPRLVELGGITGVTLGNAGSLRDGSSLNPRRR